MNRPRHLWPIVAAVACALILGYFLGRSRGRTAEAEESRGPAGVVATVKVAPIRKGRLEGRVSALGSIVPAPGAAQTVAVAYESRVVSILVSEGQAVETNSPLASVTDSPDALLALEQARIDATAAQAQLQQAQSRYALKLTDNAALAQAQQAASSTEARVKSLEARHMGAIHLLKSAGPGVVVRIATQAGAVVPAGNTLLELADTSRLEARLGLDPKEATHLRTGGAMALAPVEGGAVTQAHLRVVSPAINPVTRMSDAYAVLPPGHPFHFGQYVRADLATGSGEGLLVPYAAVLPQDGKQVLFTIRKGHAVRHEVELLVQGGELLLVSGEDLDAAEPVVVQGNYELEDGMAVEVEGPKP